jgi:hypothetical protein
MKLDSVGIKRPAVLFRGRVYVGLARHNDAIEAAFSGLTEREKRRAGNRIADGKEELIFGFAFEDGAEFCPTHSQQGRKVLYGFE